MQSFSFFVSSEDVIEKTRLDAYLTLNFDEYSRTFIQKIIKEGNVEVNGKVAKANYVIKENDEIIINIDDPKEIEINGEDIPLDILYEDDDIIVVNKKKGMVVHPAPGNYNGTLVNVLIFHCKENLSDINGVLRPGIVHRIDKNTAGILVIAKNANAHRDLTEQFKIHSITRKYRAIVDGNINDDAGVIDQPIGRDFRDRKKMAVTTNNSKRAVTHYRVLERFGDYTYIECILETGRTHQIRVHMSHIHHPLLGDDVYGRRQNEFKIEGQMLFAKVLGFIHPRTKEYIEFESPLSDEFESILDKLKRKYS